MTNVHRMCSIESRVDTCVGGKWLYEVLVMFVHVPLKQMHLAPAQPAASGPGPNGFPYSTSSYVFVSTLPVNKIK